MISRRQYRAGIAFSVLFAAYSFYAISLDVDQWWMSVWFAVGVVGLQAFSWSVFRRRNLVSYALSFIPALSLLLFFTHSLNFLYIVLLGVSEIGLIILCALDWPEARTSTYSWLGAAALLVVAAATPALVMFL